MYIKKNFSFSNIITFSGTHLLWLSIWSIAVTCFIELLHYLAHQGYDIPDFQVPYLPISLVGTAVAFYVGFKNNSAYDRLWEARKIWGGIVNNSRMWGSAVINFVTPQFTDGEVSEQDLKRAHYKLVKRHIAWLYTLRSQLLLPTPWEHIRVNEVMKKTTEKRMKTSGVGLFHDEVTQQELTSCLASQEFDEILNAANSATQLIHMQAKELKNLRKLNLIDDFRHMELQKLLNEMYDLQGKCERIKKFPLPRQYASMSFIFVGLFIFLLPFGMVTIFHELGEWGAWLSIPFSIIVGWVFVVMELIGDYSENPFEGLGNDIPMLSLCRTIEIDLLEMLGETELPAPIAAKNGILM